MDVSLSDATAPLSGVTPVSDAPALASRATSFADWPFDIWMLEGFP
jgi:hypothetical protein